MTAGTARLLIGDVFERMAELPDGSVDLVLTSPPFLALRSYLPADHPDKAKEIGSEPTPAAFLDTLLALTAEWRRVLAPHGSICVELGDTYSNTTPSGTALLLPEERVARGMPPGGAANRRIGPTTPERSPGKGWPLAKSLCGIPHLYHLSLAYGRNLLTGEPSPAGSWRVRNVVAWCRPNPPVGALGDKFRPGTSYMTVACVSGSRYFDLDAVREDLKRPSHEGSKRRHLPEAEASGANRCKPEGVLSNPAGAPPLDWWEIPTQPYAGSHYAAWPMALCERPIKAMCPQRVCTTCGEPSRRIVDVEPGQGGLHQASNGGGATVGGHPDGHRSQMGERRATTLGWSDCGHDSYRTGIVLDPFSGSGTTLAAATGHGRDAIGIDLDSRNADLAAERVGMFLEVDEKPTEGVA